MKILGTAAVVETQAELDEALASPRIRTISVSPRLHEVTVTDNTDTEVRVYGRTHVKATGNAVVHALGRATVDAHDRAFIYAGGSANVVAHDGSWVIARERSSVLALDHSTVEARDESHVAPRHFAVARAYDYARVDADGPAVSVLGHDNASLTIRGEAKGYVWDDAIARDGEGNDITEQVRR